MSSLITTTTLSALKGNNTSAYSGYVISNTDSPSLIPSNYTIASNFDPSNPLWDKSKNLSPLNTSKESMTTLIPNLQMAPMVCWIPWWGKNVYDHINIGYNQFTNNSKAVQQVADMQARELGVNIDYYGPNYDPAQTYLRDAAIAAGLPMTLMLDSNMSPSVTTTAGLNTLMDTLNTQYFSKANYVKIGGRPVIIDFGFETFPNITWSSVRSHISGLSGGNPLWLGRFSGPAVTDRGGFLDGWYGWPSPSDGVTNYLNYFYTRKSSQPTKVYWGPVFKGFNDTLASWGTGRVIAQNNGQSYADCIAAAKTHGTMLGIMLSTWNDYEEGTEVETGVGAGANLGVTQTISGNTLSWTVSGNINCIAKYRVWASLDGSALGQLGTDIAVGTNTYNLASSGITTAATYKIFVQVIGISSVVNQMSGSSVDWTVAPPPPPVDTTPPSIPQGLAVTDTTASTVSLSWLVSTDTVGVTGYRVYRDGTALATTTGLTYNDTGLTALTSYSYRVSAFDAANNESALSAAVVGTTLDVSHGPPPTPPPAPEPAQTVAAEPVAPAFRTHISRSPRRRR